MELNPNHKTTEAMHEQWHKICAILMHKFDLKHVCITSADIERSLKDQNGLFITMQELPDGLHLKMVTEEEAIRLAKKEGGLPN